MDLCRGNSACMMQAPVLSSGLFPGPRSSLWKAPSGGTRNSRQDLTLSLGSSGLPRTRGRSASGLAAAQGMAKQVEHLVLFKVKPGNDDAAAAMVAALADLEKLPGLQHLYVGPRVQPATGDEPGGSWTHALYGRYDSKDALSSYSDSPEHVSVVTGNVKPICEELVALDWEIGEGGPTGSDKEVKVVRAYMLEVSDEDAASALGEETLKKLQGSGAVRWISAGKNFSPARAKGHTWGFLVAFSDEESLKKFTDDAEQKALIEDALFKKAKKYTAIDFKATSKL